MVERRAVAVFQDRYYSALLKKVHAAAGYPVTVEVKWGTLALDHLPHTNVQDRVLRGDKLGTMLEQKL